MDQHQTETQTINPEGTTATLWFNNDSYMHDSSYVTYTVYCKFSDPALNPPHDPDLWGWEAGGVDCHYKEFKPEMAWEVGTKFYNFMMAFRTAYSLEENINHWRQRYEQERKNNDLAIEELNRLSALLLKKDQRIAELSKDYVKKLEAEIRLYKSVINMAKDRALADAKLLTLDDR